MLKIFKYLDDFDFFVVEPSYKAIAKELGLTEWNEVVWIGRFFTLDNDYGEHWFDNWELRDKNDKSIRKLGLDHAEVFIIDPDRFQNGSDGPCHTFEQRKRFWTDVLKSLEVSYETLFTEARKLNEERRLFDESEYIKDIEERINRVKIF